MKRTLIFPLLIPLFTVFVNSQNTSTGNPEDFKVRTCIHSVSYMGICIGKATLTIHEFMAKANVKQFK